MPLKSGKPSRAEVIAKLQADIDRLQDQVESLIPIPNTDQIDAMHVHLDALEKDAKPKDIFFNLLIIAVAVYTIICLYGFIRS